LDAICRQLRHDDLVKVFKKASYIGRRILGDKTDQTQLKHDVILKFYQSVMPYLVELERLDECCPAMLELVYRTYTDEQLASSVKDLSTVLVDEMSNALSKEVFIKHFNATQMQIT